MSAAHILENLTRRGARVWAEGDRIRCRGPKEVVTPEVVAELREHKADLLHALAGDDVSGEHPLDCPHMDCSTTGPKYAKIRNAGEVLEMARARFGVVESPITPPAPPGRDPLTKRTGDKPLFFSDFWRRATPEDFTAYKPGGAA